jgi:hypothetical protein
VTPEPKTPLDNQPRLYNFVLNPYPEERLSSCPFCGKRTGQRKVLLFIHIDPFYPVALNYTCRYCKACDLLIGHKHEIEFLLTEMFRQRNPDVIGNDYLIMGTLDKQAWREGLTHPMPIGEGMSHVHVFKTYYKELRMTQPGWYPAGQEPPVASPPPSADWIKPTRRRSARRRRR